MRRYRCRSKGGQLYTPSGWRLARRPSGCRVKTHSKRVQTCTTVERWQKAPTGRPTCLKTTCPLICLGRSAGTARHRRRHAYSAPGRPRTAQLVRAALWQALRGQPRSASQLILSLDGLTALSSSGTDATGRQRRRNGTAAAMPAGRPSRRHSGAAGWSDSPMTPFIYLAL